MIVYDRLTMIERQAQVTSEQQVYTPEEVATAARITRLTVYRHLALGQLRGTKIGRQWRISQESLDSYLGALEKS